MLIGVLAALTGAGLTCVFLKFMLFGRKRRDQDVSDAVAATGDGGVGSATL